MARSYEVVRDGDGFRVDERRAVPTIAIGRFALPKVKPKDERWVHPLERYQDQLAERNRGRGLVIEPEKLFMAYVDPETFTTSLNRPSRSRNAGPGRQGYEMRAVKRNIATALHAAQRLDGERQLIELERLTREGQQLEPGEEVICTNESDDPGPFGLWGTVSVQLRSQPVLIDERTVGVRAFSTSELDSSYCGLKAVLRHEGSLDTIGMDVNTWQPVIPVFIADEPIKTDLHKSEIKIPKPPQHVVFQEIKITEL